MNKYNLDAVHRIVGNIEVLLANNSFPVKDVQAVIEALQWAASFKTNLQEVISNVEKARELAADSPVAEQNAAGVGSDGVSNTKRRNRKRNQVAT